MQFVTDLPSHFHSHQDILYKDCFLVTINRLARSPSSTTETLNKKQTKCALVLVIIPLISFPISRNFIHVHNTFVLQKKPGYIVGNAQQRPVRTRRSYNIVWRTHRQRAFLKRRIVLLAPEVNCQLWIKEIQDLKQSPAPFLFEKDFDKFEIAFQ